MSDPAVPAWVAAPDRPGDRTIPASEVIGRSTLLEDPPAEAPQGEAPQAEERDRSSVGVLTPAAPGLTPADLDEGRRRRGRPGPPPPPLPPAPPEGSGSGPGRRKPRKIAAILLLTIASALVVVAMGVGGYPFYTDFQAARHQKALKAQFDAAGRQSAADRQKLLDQYKNRSFAIGSPVTRIIIPKLGVQTVVVEGTSDQALAAGAGHYPQSPLPGDVGNVAIAGHRTMNGHPFGDLDKLAPGDQVILETPFATYTYQLIGAFDGHANPWVTTPEDWSVISVTTQSKLLTLTTCNPKGQKTQRLIARAQLVSSQPVA